MRILNFFLRPFAMLYQSVVYLRNLCYDRGWMKSATAKVPTLVVGNLSVGGSGKTPMIEFILRYCLQDFRVAVVSRGYRRSSKGYKRLDASDTAHTVGDEPLQLFHRFKSSVPVAVDVNRLNAIDLLLKTDALDAVVLDDAFQHRRLRATFNVVLTNYALPFYEDHYLPMGRLRDHKNQVKRADVMVVTKCPETLDSNEAAAIQNRIQQFHRVAVFFACSRYGEDFLKMIPLLKGQRVALVTGLANAKNLQEDLLRMGIHFDAIEKPDHHSYNQADISALAAYDWILTTSKDEVKLAALWNDRLPTRLVVEVEHRLLFNAHADFVRTIREGLFKIL